MVQSGCSDAVTLCLLVENKGLLGRVHKFFDQIVLYQREKKNPSDQFMKKKKKKIPLDLILQLVPKLGHPNIVKNISV